MNRPASQTGSQFVKFLVIWRDGHFISLSEVIRSIGNLLLSQFFSWSVGQLDIYPAISQLTG